VASIARAATARLSDATKAGEVCRFDDMGWGVKSLAFSPAGNLLAAGKSDRALWLFDVPRKSRCNRSTSWAAAISGTRVHPTGSHLLAAGRTAHIIIYEVSRDGLMKESGHSQAIRARSPAWRFLRMGSL
jgi:WD40 repeat protein